MCGIAGTLCSEAFRDQAGDIQHMLAALGHRGPDGKGIVHTRAGLGPSAASFSLALGATRLSLLDEAGGAQPFRDSCGGLLVFNGEIFNWLDLRAELIEQGRHLRTRCDTEIVAELFERDGVDAAAKLDGMFGLGFFDGRRLLLARDAFGIKPLYFVWDPRGWFVFASEIKALLRCGFVAPRLSREALFETAVFCYPLDHLTLFADIQQVPPGTIIEVNVQDDGTLNLQTTVFDSFPWQSMPEKTQGADDAVMDLLEDQFVRSVQEQLVADHPVGVFLSGGVDSSAILAAAAADNARELHTFAVGDDHNLADLQTARYAAERMGCRHHEVIIGFEEFINEIPRAVLAMEAPRPPSGGEFLARAARMHTKAALCGEGSDELFGGYWVHMRPREFLKMLLSRYVFAYGMAGDGAPRSRIQKLLRWLAERDPEELAHKVWLFYLRAPLANAHLVPWDHATMCESLELRVPYLSQRIARVMRSYPRAAMLPAGSKPLVRRLVRRFMPTDVADAVLNRPKIAFPASTQSTVRQLREVAASVVPETHRRNHPLKHVLPLAYSANDHSPRDPTEHEAESLGVLLLDMFVLIFCVHRGELREGLSIKTLYTDRSFRVPLVEALNEVDCRFGGPVEDFSDSELLEAALR